MSKSGFDDQPHQGGRGRQLDAVLDQFGDECVAEVDRALVGELEFSEQPANRADHRCAREFAVLEMNPDFALMLEARRAALEVTRLNAGVDAHLQSDVIDQVLRGVR